MESDKNPNEYKGMGNNDYMKMKWKWNFTILSFQFLV